MDEYIERDVLLGGRLVRCRDCWRYRYGGRCGWLMLYTGRITPATPPRRAPEGHCVWSDRRGGAE